MTGEELARNAAAADAMALARAPEVERVAYALAREYAVRRRALALDERPFAVPEGIEAARRTGLWPRYLAAARVVVDHGWAGMAEQYVAVQFAARAHSRASGAVYPAELAGDVAVARFRRWLASPAARVAGEGRSGVVESADRHAIDRVGGEHFQVLNVAVAVSRRDATLTAAQAFAVAVESMAPRLSPLYVRALARRYPEAHAAAMRALGDGPTAVRARAIGPGSADLLAAEAAIDHRGLLQ